LAVAPRARALTLTFSNSSAVSGSNVWVMFGGQNNGTLSGTLTYSGTTQAIAFGASYQLSEISGSISLVNATAGKIFISYGSGLTGPNTTLGNPDFQYQSLDPLAQVRWDKVEYSLFSNTSQGLSAINMTAADFFSIPLQITALLNDVVTGTVGWHPQPSTATVFYNLGTLAPGPNQPYAVVTATAAIGQPYSLATTLSGTTFNVLRLINPNTVNGGVTNPYSSLLPYALYTGTTGTTAKLASFYFGNASGTNGLPVSAWAQQNYNFTSTVDASGNMWISGSGDAVGSQTITIRAADLEAGLYSNAPNYYLKTFNNGTSALQNTNCVYDQVIGDVLAAYNMGLVGSTVSDPRFTGTLVGTESSAQWYSVFATPYENNPQFTPAQLFSAMQPNSPAGTPFYNPFAAYLSSVSDVYGFPYTDKSAKPQLDITPGSADTIVITILPDVVPPPGAETPRPGRLPVAIRDNQIALSRLNVRGRRGAVNPESIKVHVNIAHPRIEELTVRLISPDGRKFLLHDKTGGSTANLVLPGVRLPRTSGSIRPNGGWILWVRDGRKGNLGRIVDWSLEVP
jgi:hypothetical protein